MTLRSCSVFCLLFTAPCTPHSSPLTAFDPPHAARLNNLDNSTITKILKLYIQCVTMDGVSELVMCRWSVNTAPAAVMMTTAAHSPPDCKACASPNHRVTTAIAAKFPNFFLRTGKIKPR